MYITRKIKYYLKIMNKDEKILEYEYETREEAIKMFNKIKEEANKTLNERKDLEEFKKYNFVLDRVETVTETEKLN